MGIINGTFDTDLSGWIAYGHLPQSETRWDNGRALVHYIIYYYHPYIYQDFLIDDLNLSFDWQTSTSDSYQMGIGWSLVVLPENIQIAGGALPFNGSGHISVNISQYLGKNARITFYMTAGGYAEATDHKMYLWIDNVILSPNWGTFNISSDPIGAEIWIDGDNTGFLTPKIIPEITPGSHTVTLKKTEYYDYTTTIDVVAGRTYIISPILEMQVGKINFNSFPAGAKIYLSERNGDILKDTGFVTPYIMSNLPWGTYIWRLHKDFYKDESGSVIINTREVVFISKTLIPSGNISFMTEPVGANIIIDGILQEGLTTPVIIGVIEGWHHYVLNLLNYDSIENDIYVYLGQTVQVTKTLLPSIRGSINFVSIPEGAEIFIDGKDQRIKTPVVITDVSAGTHEYILKLTQFKDYIDSVLVEESKTTQVSVILTPTEGCIYFDSEPAGAKIYLDSTPETMIDTTFTTPHLFCNLSLGTHCYKLVLPEYVEETGCITLETGLGEIIIKTMSPVKKYEMLLIGAAALGLGAVGLYYITRKRK